MIGFADAGPPFTARLVRLASEQVAADPADRVVLVLHSGAGVLAPYLADQIGSGGVIVVFADAAIPPRVGDVANSPRAGEPEAVTVTDAAFLAVLRDLATGGMVPPWPAWWPQEAMAELIPDERTRRLVLGEARPLPLAYFEEVLPPQPASWPSCRPGYLKFSEGYVDLAREAADRGWPVSELPGEHLHMLVDPAAVADAIVGLVADIADSA